MTFFPHLHTYSTNSFCWFYSQNIYRVSHHSCQPPGPGHQHSACANATTSQQIPVFHSWLQRVAAWGSTEQQQGTWTRPPCCVKTSRLPTLLREETECLHPQAPCHLSGVPFSSLTDPIQFRGWDTSTSDPFAGGVELTVPSKEIIVKKPQSLSVSNDPSFFILPMFTTDLSFLEDLRPPAWRMSQDSLWFNTYQFSV